MIISVASGKGGTGKTMVATSLALSLSKERPVKLLDCDVEEPNAHILLKPSLDCNQTVSIPVPQVDEDKCNHCGRCAEVCAYNAIAVIAERVLVFPELCHGCGACRYLCPEGAIYEEGRKVGVVQSGRSENLEFVHGQLSIGEVAAPRIINEVTKHLDRQILNIIDAPPGTSCPVVAAVKKSDFCLLVTEPTCFGLNDLALAVAVIKELKIPCGVVINRDGLGDNEVEEYCLKETIPILMRIPLDIEIARLYSQGITLTEGITHWQKAFLELFDKIERLTGNANGREGGSQ